MGVRRESISHSEYCCFINTVLKMVNECTAYVLRIAWSDYLAHPKWTAVIKRNEADGGQKHKTNNSQKGKHVCVRVKDIRTDCQLQTSLKAQLYLSILSNYRLWTRVVAMVSDNNYSWFSKKLCWECLD